MMDYINLLTKVRTRKPKPLVKLPILVEKVDSVIEDGLLKSVVKEVQLIPDDAHLHYRDFSLQTVLRADAIDLLKPLGSLPTSRLNAADTVDIVSGQFEALRSKVNEFKTTVESVESANNTTVKSVESANN